MDKNTATLGCVILFLLLLTVPVGSTVTMSPTSPSNATWTIDATPSFVFSNITSNDSTQKIDCELFIDQTTYNESLGLTANNSYTVVANASLSTGYHEWNVTCNDTETSNITGNFELYVFLPGEEEKSTSLFSVALLSAIVSAVVALVLTSFRE